MGLGEGDAAVMIVSLVVGFLLGAGVVGVSGWMLYRRGHRQALAHQAENAREREKRHGDEMRRLWKAHRAEIRELESAGLETFSRLHRERWLQSLRLAPWGSGAPEIEVEAKFVFPLLSFLGYDDEEMELRTVVPVQEGSRPSSIEADWVVRDEQGRALMVVEVKAPGVPLGEAVREQARSYAFRLCAPVYVLTNGGELQVYHVGVLRDLPVVACLTAELAEQWEAVVAHAGKSSVVALRAELEGEKSSPGAAGPRGGWGAD